MRAAFLAPLIALGVAACVPATPPVDDATPPPARPRSPRPSPTLAPGEEPPPVVNPNTPITTVARGLVFDATGQPAGPGYDVHIHSTERTLPFDRNADVVQGRYAIIGVPTHAGLVFTLEQGPTPLVVRSVPPVKLGAEAIVNFGGPATSDDPDAPHYALPAGSPSPSASPV